MTFYSGKNVLVTGGLGFIGSNLALRLAALGANVTVVDPCVPGCGGNPKNLEGACSPIRVFGLDIGSPELPDAVLRRQDVVFNLAGEVSHMASMREPERDLAINTVAQLLFLQRVAQARPGIRIVFAGTRQVYGVPDYLPVDENHPIHPVDFNGVHKYAATMYHLMLSSTGLVDACVLRLTNVYGPRVSLDTPGQGVLAAFLRNLSRGERLEVFGDGRQLRDPVYVDDVVEAFLLAGAAVKLPSRSYNIGGPAGMELRHIAMEASALAGVGSPVYREFSKELKAIDIGSYCADSSRIRDELGWTPTTCFSAGIAKTLEHYRVRVAAHA
jgi:UDP-glucose 4-epimerase